MFRKQILLWGLLPWMIGCSKGAVDIPQYYVVINPMDCTNCLAAGYTLAQKPYFKAIQYVLPKATAPALAAKILRELVHVEVPPARIIYDDSLYARLAIGQRSSFMFTRGAQTVAWGRLDGVASNGVAIAVDGQKMTSAHWQLAPDTVLYSPNTLLYCGSKHFWVYDGRLEHLQEFAYAMPTAPIAINAKSWPLRKAYAITHGDTSGFKQVRQLLPVLKSIGKDKIELVGIQPMHDTLYASAVYREPVAEIKAGTRAINVYPKPLLVRLDKGQPIEWHSLAQFDSAKLGIRVPWQFARFTKTNQWLLPICSLEEDQKTIPYLAWAFEDKQSKVHWQKLHSARLPAFFEQRQLNYNYNDYRLIYPYVVFKYANSVANLQSKSGLYTSLTDFSDKLNNFKNLAAPVIDFEIIDAIQHENNLVLLVRQGENLHMVALNDDLSLYAQVLLPIRHHAAIKWAWREDGALCGFDVAKHTFFLYRNVAGS